MRISKAHIYGFTWRKNERAKISSSPNGGDKFFSPVTKPKTPKLYIISDGESPIYVGKTNSSITSRLGSGLVTNVRNPYGYLWRHYLNEATIFVWVLTVEERDIKSMSEDPSMMLATKKKNQSKKEEIVVETLEAEVAVLIKETYGGWPKYQNEIHFHQSSVEHETDAKKILSDFRKATCPTA